MVFYFFFYAFNLCAEFQLVLILYSHHPVYNLENKLNRIYAYNDYSQRGLQRNHTAGDKLLSRRAPFPLQCLKELKFRNRRPHFTLHSYTSCEKWQRIQIPVHSATCVELILLTVKLLVPTPQTLDEPTGRRTRSKRSG